MPKYLYLLFLTAQGICISSRAQTGVVFGKIKTTDSTPLESATVSLLTSKDSSLIKIAVADRAGGYRFENIQYGTYLVRAGAVGHKKNNSKIFEINSARPVF